MIITRTGTSKSIRRSCEYIGDYSTKAHKNANGVTKRNQALVGIGVNNANTKSIIDSFRRLESKKPQTKVKLVNFVISPKPGTIDRHNPQDIANFAEYARRVVKQAFPHHMALIAVQSDNKHAITHAHLLVSNLNTTPPHYAINHRHITKAYVSHVAENVRKHGFSKPSDPLTLDKVERLNNPQKRHIDAHTVKSNDLSTKVIMLENQIHHSHLTYKQAKRYAKSIGIQMKRSRTYRRVEHEKNADGTYKRNKYGRKIVKYRRTRDGKHFIWRKNKHGNRVKVPKRTTSQRHLLFRLTPKKSTPAKHRHYRSFNWLELTEDTAELYREFRVNSRRYKPSRAKRGKSITKQTKTAHTPKISHSKPTYTQATASSQPTKALNQPTQANSQATADDDLRMLKIAPKIEPALHGLSQDDGTVLKDDIDLMPTFSKSAFSDKDVRKSQQTKALRQLGRNSQNVTKPNARRFRNIIISIARRAELDYHKTAIMARHYAKAIHEYFIKLKKKTAEKLTKQRTTASNKHKARYTSNSYAQHLLRKLSQDKANETQRQALNRKRKHKHDKPAYNPGNAGGAKVRRRIAEHQKARRANYQAHNHGNHFERT